MNLTPLGVFLTAVSIYSIFAALNGSLLQLAALAITPLLIWFTWAAYRIHKRRQSGR